MKWSQILRAPFERQMIKTHSEFLNIEEINE